MSRPAGDAAGMADLEGISGVSWAGRRGGSRFCALGVACVGRISWSFGHDGVAL